MEVVIDDKEHYDTASITDQDHMLAIISDVNKHRTSLRSLISDDSEEDEGITDPPANSHYCYGGSAGHSAQSNTSSERASCTSATFLSSDL